METLVTDLFRKLAESDSKTVQIVMRDAELDVVWAELDVVSYLWGPISLTLSSLPVLWSKCEVYLGVRYPE